MGASAQTCANMFDGCTNLGTADLSGLDTSAVTDMSSMFANCPALISVPTGLTLASGVTVDKLFYVDSETAIALQMYTQLRLLSAAQLRLLWEQPLKKLLPPGTTSMV